MAPWGQATPQAAGGRGCVRALPAPAQLGHGWGTEKDRLRDEGCSPCKLSKQPANGTSTHVSVRGVQAEASQLRLRLFYGLDLAHQAPNIAHFSVLVSIYPSPFPRGASLRL